MALHKVYIVQCTLYIVVVLGEIEYFPFVSISIRIFLFFIINHLLGTDHKTFQPTLSGKGRMCMICRSGLVFLFSAS